MEGAHHHAKVVEQAYLLSCVTGGTGALIVVCEWWVFVDSGGVLVAVCRSWQWWVHMDGIRCWSLLVGGVVLVGAFWLPVATFVEKLKNQKNRSRPVATGLSSSHVLDLTHAHFLLIVGL